MDLEQPQLHRCDRLRARTALTSAMNTLGVGALNLRQQGNHCPARCLYESLLTCDMHALSDVRVRIGTQCMHTRVCTQKCIRLCAH